MYSGQTVQLATTVRQGRVPGPARGRSVPDVRGLQQDDGGSPRGQLRPEVSAPWGHGGVEQP